MSLPDPRSFRLDAKTVFAGIVLPGICFIVDYLTGEWITSPAPAALLTLYALGSGSLVLSSTLDPRSRAWSLVAGSLAAASVAVCVIALPIVLLALAVARAGIIALGSHSIYSEFSSIGFELLGLSALGFGTLWTAWVFVQRAYLAVQTSARVHVPLQALGLGVLGAAFLAGATFGADRIDRWWVTSQIEQISKSSPDRWPVVLAKLSAYPLCGRERCNKLVCDRLFMEFGWDTPDGLYYPPRVPPEHEETLTKFLGGPTSERCRRGD